MRAGQREARLGVIEGCGLPGCGVVADVAGLRESAGNVVGIRSSLEILQVARDAGGAVQVVVVVDVTIGAGARWHGMQSGERKPGAVVVELRVRPVAGGMTLLAGLREVRSRVVGVRCSLEVLKAAGRRGGVRWCV